MIFISSTFTNAHQRLAASRLLSAGREKMDFLFSALKLLKEAHIVLREQTQVGNLILQVGDTLHTEAEGITGIYLAVYAAKLQHVGVNHSAAQDFHPSCMLAESAALTAADVA